MHALRLFILVAAVSALAACGADDPPPEPTPTAAAPALRVTVVTGCDAPQPEQGFEALGLVRVTDDSGEPQPGLQVEGEIAGAAVVNETAVDETVENGEALLFFAVAEPGDYTITVTRITGARGVPRPFDGDSISRPVAVTGADCEWP
jgi:hypothetical protein